MRTKSVASIVLLVCLFAIPLSGFGVDVFAPSLPAIQKYFQTTSELTRSAIGLFMLFFAVGQLPFGILSDRYGRKPILLIGIIVFACSSLLAVFVHSIHLFLLLRCFQGFGAAGTSAVSKSVINDYYEGLQRRRAFTYMVSSWGAGTIMAPFIGGYLQHYIGWQASFYFLAAYGLFVTLLIIFLLPETLPQESSIHPRVLGQQIWRMWSNRYFWLGVLLTGVGYGTIIIFSTVSPHVIQVSMGYSAVTYGHVALFVGAAWVLGSIVNRQLIHRYSVAQIINTSLIILVLLAVLYVFMSYHLSAGLLEYVVPLFLMIFSAACYYPICTSMSIILFSDIAGIASAMIGVCGFTVTSIISMLASVLQLHSQIQVAWFYLALAISGLLIALVIRCPVLEN